MAGGPAASSADAFAIDALTLPCTACICSTARGRAARWRAASGAGSTAWLVAPGTEEALRSTVPDALIGKRRASSFQSARSVWASSSAEPGRCRRASPAMRRPARTRRVRLQECAISLGAAATEAATRANANLRSIFAPSRR